MKIVHVVSEYLPETTGGTQLQLQILCSAQQERGHEVRIFTRLGSDQMSEYSLVRDVVAGVEVTRVVNNFSDVDQFARIFSNPAIDRVFEEFLEAEAPDLVHIHHLSCLSTSMVEVAKNRGISLVMWLSDFWLACPRGQRWHPFDESICNELDRSRCLSCLEKLWPHLLSTEGEDAQHSRVALGDWELHVKEMVDLCDATLVPSEFHRDRFLEWGLDESRCHVVTYGLRRAELLAAPREHRPIRRIGYIGTVLPSKGVHTLVEAFNLLDRDDLELHIHGEAPSFHGNTSYVSDLLELTEKPDALRFHGGYELEELPAVFRNFDLLVIPSVWWESYCLTAREGVLAGLPVIASNLAGLGEAVDQEMVIGFEAGDAADLADAIRRVCDDATLRSEMSRKADLVRDHRECAAQIEHIYFSVVDPHVTLVIPTWNAGPEFPEILDSMLAQELDRPFEVLVIDSGSSDGTAEFLRTKPLRLIEIPNTEFNHGETRNLGIQNARGRIVVLATQDARPTDQLWMQRLVDCFEEPTVAGAYSRQLPRVDANIFIKDRLASWAAATTERRIQSVADRDEYDALLPLERLGRCAFDNVSSAVRKSVALSIPFRKRQFGEDIDWAQRAILAGHEIVFEPRSAVVHSHNNSIWYEFKRVYLDHQNLHRVFGVHTIPKFTNVLTCTRQAIGHLKNVIRQADLGPARTVKWRLRAIPYGFSQNLAQYLGARSVRKLPESRFARFLDSKLRRGV